MGAGGARKRIRVGYLPAHPGSLHVSFNTRSATNPRVDASTHLDKMSNCFRISATRSAHVGRQSERPQRVKEGEQRVPVAPPTRSERSDRPATSLLAAYTGTIRDSRGEHLVLLVNSLTFAPPLPSTPREFGMLFC